MLGFTVEVYRFMKIIGKDADMVRKRCAVIYAILTLFLISGICLSQTLPKAKTLTVSSSSATISAEPEIGQISDATKSEKTLAKEQNSTYILSKSSPSRTTSAVTVYDFTTGSDKYYGGTVGAKELETGVWGMIAGDVDQNGIISAADRVEVFTSSGFGYLDEDVDLSGIINAVDRVISGSASGFSPVP